MQDTSGIWKWAGGMVDVAPPHRVTLGEGDTPLVRSRRIGPAAGLRNLWFKVETGNPAGSFKDRFGAAAVSHMLSTGKTDCVATSSGNTGAALAAYCAAAGVRCHIAVVETAPQSKLRQMLAYGARVFRVREFGLDADVTRRVCDELEVLGRRPGRALQISAFVYSPEGMSGVQSIAYELAEQADRPIDHVFCPAGGGGLCVAMGRGFGHLVDTGRLERSPAVECVQPEGNDTIAGPLRRGEGRARSVTCTSRISGLQVASVVDGDLAVEACRASGGSGHLVSDEEVWEAQRRLAREEGLFSEPAGATALAGVLRAAAEGRVASEANVVCLVTGTGFKDEASIDRMVAGVECPMLDVEEVAGLE